MIRHRKLKENRWAVEDDGHVLGHVFRVEEDDSWVATYGVSRDAQVVGHFAGPFARYRAFRRVRSFHRARMFALCCVNKPQEGWRL